MESHRPIGKYEDLRESLMDNYDYIADNMIISNDMTELLFERGVIDRGQRYEIGQLPIHIRNHMLLRKCVLDGNPAVAYDGLVYALNRTGQIELAKLINLELLNRTDLF